MAGFGGGFGFGQSQPFGASTSSPFGQAFGQPQASSPFGTATGAAAFGATPAQPAFGAASTPAFGAATTSAFGATAFGAQPKPPGAFGGFGAPSASPFGASQSAFATTSTPAFGAASAPAFGAAATPAFGAAATPAFGSSSPFGAGTFGAASTPAFGAAGTPAFGAASTPAFGAGSSFGATPAFGGGGAMPAFGQPTVGTRSVPYQKTTDTDSSTTTGGVKTQVLFNSMTAMPQYQGKSAEELRWEDYQAGVKGNTGAAAAPAFGSALGSSPFGAAGSPFGATQAAPAFGAPAATPAFGAASTPAFGFGASPTAFGAPAAAPAFGAASTPAFGAGSPFGAAPAAPFGAASTPAFGAASAPAFGAASTPAFGAPAASSPFGAPTSAFGTPGAFGNFGATSAPSFGQASTPAFGTGTFGATTSQAPFGAASTPAFGAASTPAFGFAQPASAFGAGTSQPFGQPATSASPFGQPAASAAPFGGSLFGQPAQAKPAFGATSSPFGGFGATSQPFGQPQAAPAFGASPSPGAFSFATSAPAPSSSAFGGFGTPAAASPFNFSLTPQQTAGQQQQQQLVPAQMPGAASSPYGTLPPLPQVAALPEHRVGLSQRPVGVSGPPRPPAVLTPRSITPRSGVRLRPTGPVSIRSASRLARSPGDFLSTAGSPAGTPGSAGGAASGAGSLFVARDDPRRLFIQAPLPSTESATVSSPAPARRAGGTATPPRARASNNDKNGTPRQSGLARHEAADGGTPQQEQRQQRAHRESPADADRGKGPARQENGRAQAQDVEQTLDDDEVAALLPRLAEPDYYCEPGLAQLAAAARQDPDSLAAVANFTVGRRGVGSVRWLEAVDVRGLQLDAIVRLSKGSVEVYLDERDKPEVGAGLNRAARVTLLRVHKLDKASGRPTSDPDALARFERKLKKIVAAQGARWLGYDAQEGTWQFEVEHFSRYGLAGDSEDEEEDMDDDAAQQPPPPAPAQTNQDIVDEDSMEADVDDLDLDHEAAPSEGASADAGDAGTPAPRAWVDNGPAASPVLAHALPAALGLDPAGLQHMRDTLFPAAAGPAVPPAVARPAHGKRRAAALPGPVPVPAAAPAAQLVAGGALATAAHLAGPTAAPRAWQPPAPALQPIADEAPSSYTGSTPGRHFALTPPPAAHRLGSAVASPPASALSPTQCPVAAAPGPDGGATARCLVDAGLLLGSSFRVGWGPGALLAFAGAGSAQSSVPASTISLQRVALNAHLQPGAPPQEQAALSRRMRSRLEAALQLHAEYSSPDPPSLAAAVAGEPDEGDMGAAPEDDEGEQRLPHWSLKCSRRGQLEEMHLRYLKLYFNHLNQAGLESPSPERTVALHAAGTWQLLHVLFSHIPGEQVVPGSLQEEPRQLADRDGEDGMHAEAGPSGELAVVTSADGNEAVGPAQRLAAFQRRAGLSRWFKQKALIYVEAGLRRAGAAPARALQLLSGGQLAAAAGEAARAGDVRLATLIAQGGTKSSARRQLARQLAVWGEAGFLAALEAQRADCYRLLAGGVDQVLPGLPGLDWRRAAACHLWYMHSPAAPVGEALASYSAAVQRQAAPPPRPLYAERHPELAPAATAAVDVDYLLLELAAGEVAGDPSWLPRLLAPASTTPDPLDAAAAWLLLGTLRALRALDRALPDAAVDALPQVYALHLDLVLQLEAAGGMPEWALYVALHLPNHPSPAYQGLREALVQDLLTRHAPAWAASPQRRAFLTRRLGLPPAWLAGALAQWARYRHDPQGELGFALDACDWPRAHVLLCSHAAPRLVAGGQLAALRRLLDRLAPHADAIDAAAGSTAWRWGGKVYDTYLWLKEGYSSGPGAEEQIAERQQACEAFAQLLAEAAQQWGSGNTAASSDSHASDGSPQQDFADGSLQLDPVDSSQQRGGPLQQVVFARMAEELAVWALQDARAAGAPELPVQTFAAGLGPLAGTSRLLHLHAAAASLAAAQVAAHWSVHAQQVVLLCAHW